MLGSPTGLHARPLHYQSIGMIFLLLAHKDLKMIMSRSAEFHVELKLGGLFIKVSDNSKEKHIRRRTEI